MKKAYKLEDLDCAVCAQKIEDGVKNVEGVVDASVSFVGQRIVVDFAAEANVDKVMDNIVKVCKKIEPDCVIKR